MFGRTPTSYRVSKILFAGIFAAAFLMSGFFVPNAQAAIVSLQVTSPNGGELLGGGVGMVTWTNTGGVPGDLIDIALVDDVLHSAVVIAPNVAFDASPYAWTGLPSVPNGSNYRVQIFKAGTSVPYDMSDGVFAIDNTPPTIVSFTTYDIDGDGTVERASVTFSESVLDSSFAPFNFAVGGVAGFFDGSGPGNDDTLDMSTSSSGTGVKSFLYVSGNGHDLAVPGNRLATVSGFATDAAAPVFLSARTTTTSTINATFSEDIDGGTLNTSGSEFAVEGHMVSGASELAGVVTLTLSTTMGTGEAPVVTFTNIDNFRDLAGNQAISPITRTATDGVVPILTSVSIASSNTDPAFAQVGNTVTVSFTSSEAIITPAVMIAGSTATSVTNVGGNDWTASRAMTDSDSEGPVVFTIDFHDLALNPGGQVTAVTDGSSVTFDKTNPSVSITTPAADSVTTAGSVGAVFGVTDTNPGTCAYTIDGGGSTPINCAGDVIGGLSDGRRMLEVTATDAAGNSASATVSFVINIDANLTVGAGKDFTTIQEAVNKATTGDTITIDAGAYAEDVIISGKNLTLTGVGPVTATSFTLTNTFVSGSTNVGAPLVNINPGAKIQDGVLLAVGSTVNVAAGEYNEQVVINKALTLQGAGNTTVIKPSQTTANAFQLFNRKAGGLNNTAGIIVTNAGAGDSITVKNLKVDGSLVSSLPGGADFLAGVLYRGNGGLIDSVTVQGIGIANGNGIYISSLGDTVSVEVKNNIISGYLKNGVTANFSGLTANIHNNEVTGMGATTSIAQNGIQIGFGAEGSVTNNTVVGNIWTDTYGGTNNPASDDEADGASGILLYMPGSVAVEVANNILSGNQFGVWTVAAVSVNIHNNTITGLPHTGNAFPTGITIWTADMWTDDFGGSEVATAGTVQRNTISTGDYGVLVRDFIAGGPVPSVGLHLNGITGNAVFGAWADSSTDAERNWWGDMTGPYHSPENLLGAGNAVSDNVDYSPWCTNPGCTEFGSNDPLNHLELFLDPGTPGVPGSVILPGSANMTVTAKDAANITRVNETALVSLSADGSATIVGGNFFPPFNSGIATADITDSVAEIVNVGAAAGGKTVIGQIIFSAVTVPDTVPPVVTLLGMNPVTLTVGDTFTDPGATANDNIDGDITESIVVGGDIVDTGIAGTYVVTYDVSDSAVVPNVAIQEKRYVIVIEPDVTPIIPTVALNGTAIVSAYTITEATARFASGLQFDTTGAASVTVNGSSVAPAATITAATQAQATTLGAHTYNMVVTSPTGDTANITVAYQVNVDPTVQGNGELAVTGIDMVANANGSTGFAMANDSFADGWAWVFHVTVPTDETLFAMKFSDFVSGPNSILAAENIRFHSAQSLNEFIVIEDANVYSSDATLATDLNSGMAGRQIDVRVEVKVPVGTAGGSYSTSYGVRSQTDDE